MNNQDVKNILDDCENDLVNALNLLNSLGITILAPISTEHEIRVKAG